VFNKALTVLQNLPLKVRLKIVLHCIKS